ncbi:MAG: terminase TerL endonuclease subunit [Anaerovoracaceae bacterium]|nr:terminase TerL endonuclease subunit [Anaerovoracaceae bacterium]
MNYVKEYYELLKSGKEPACIETMSIYKRMVEEMGRPINDPFRFYFDEEVGEHVIIFIETFCRHYEGEHAGELVRLELWQKAFVQCIFGWLEKETGLRRFREYALEVPRKHGKSFLSGCIATYMLVADGEPGAQVYSAANKLDQAKIVYTVAKNIVDQSSELRALVKSTREGLYFGMTRSVMKPLPNESKSLDGLNIHFASMDEIHETRDRNLYDVLKQGMKARRQPLLGCITTSGFFREGLYDNLHDYWVAVARGEIQDDRILPVIYKLDEEDEWLDPAMWKKANPGLGTIKSYQQLADDVERAKKDNSYKPTLLAKDFNMKQNQKTAWLPYSVIVNEDTYDMEQLRKSYAIGGCDLSATTDLTCATLLIRKPGTDKIYVLQHYFLPQSKIDKLDKGSDQEAPYKVWAEKGWLTICEGAQVNYHDVTMWFVSMVRDYNIRPLWLCYDRALAGYWVDEMEQYGFEMEKVAQGPFTWSQPMKEMGAAFEEGRVNYNNNPVLRWCLCNTAKKSLNQDGIETIQPVKIQQNRRIDGTVSLLNAWVGYVKHYDEYMPYVK